MHSPFPQRGIYIHVPWCRRRCPYCDFVFEVGQACQDYAESVLNEYRTRMRLLEATYRAYGIAMPPLVSIYFGGGTPSMLPAAQREKIIENILELEKRDSQDLEITLEVNPEDVGERFIASIATSHVNRYSLGIQSFDDRVLRGLGRAHSASEAKDALASLRNWGRVHMDLIIGTPFESEGRLKQDISQADSLGAHGVSAYSLTIERGTNFDKRVESGSLKVLDDDDHADAYILAQNLLDEVGYRQVEVSNYAKEGFEPVHNRIYWGRGSYLGLGPGAHSLTLWNPLNSVTASTLHFCRSANTSDIQQWLQLWKDNSEDGLIIESREHALREKRSALSELNALSVKECWRENLAFGLRDKLHGVCAADLAKRLQLEVSSEGQQALKHVWYNFHASQWIEYEGATLDFNTRVYPTTTGMRFLDAMSRDLLTLEFESVQ